MPYLAASAANCLVLGRSCRGGLRSRLRRFPRSRWDRNVAQEEESLTDTVVEALILELLDWLSARGRSYEEALAAWRTSCPRLPVWEEANDRGLIERVETNGTLEVRVTPAGRALLERRAVSNRVR